MKCREMIVVVDDESAQRLVVAAILEEKGYQVACFASTQAALAFIKTHAPELVLSDLGLPDQAGMAFVEHIKTLNPNTECILMTGFATLGSAIEAMRLGVRDYLVKPFRRAELLRAVERVLQTRVANTSGSPVGVSAVISEDSADDLIARCVHKLNNAMLPFVFELDQHLAQINHFDDLAQQKLNALQAEIIALNTVIKNIQALIKPR